TVASVTELTIPAKLIILLTNRPILASGLAPLLPDTSIQPGTSRTSETPVDETREGLALHPLLRKLLQLSDPSFSTSAVQREALVPSSLTTLNMLLERAQERQLSRFQCVVSSPALSRCLSLDSSYQTLSLSVSLLAGLAHSDELAFRICCHTGNYGASSVTKGHGLCCHTVM
uniref:Uncharacterized protein n=1 Tax=Hucho hucho TaxID=62062 RepID=A0A4W5R1R9_9TELE